MTPGTLHLPGYWDETILAVWREGLDTLAIARLLQLPEYAVYNRLLGIRTRAREAS